MVGFEDLRISDCLLALGPGCLLESNTREPEVDVSLTCVIHSFICLARRLSFRDTCLTIAIIAKVLRSGHVCVGCHQEIMRRFHRPL